MLIRDLLTKYKNLKIVDKELKEFIINKFKNDFNYNLNTQDIKRQGKIIYLNIIPTLKTEVLIQKQTIIKLLQNIDKGVVDIR